MKILLQTLLIIFSFASCLAFAENITLKPYTIDRSEVVDIHSNANGKDYELYIKLPSTYQQDSHKKYPLIVLADGPYTFPVASSVVLRMSEIHGAFEEPIIVGLSFSKGDVFPISRTRDYTPTNVPAKNGEASSEAKNQSGKAAQYSQFLANEVLPYLMTHYRINNAKKLFAGHSYGGLLGSYILVSQPDLFNYYLIGSPSLDYDHNIIFTLEANYAKTHKSLPAKIFMATGDEEGSVITDMLAFAKELKSHHYQDLNVSTKILKGESHISGYPSFLTQGLLWALPNTAHEK